MNPSDPVRVSSAETAGSPAPRRPGLWAVGAAVAAGLAAWLAGESGWTRVAPKTVAMVTMGVSHASPSGATSRAAESATAARTYGALGLALGLALGAAGGLARRDVRAAARAAFLGASLGAVAGAGVAYGAVPLYQRGHDSFQVDLVPSMLMHGAIWGAVGASAALAFGLGVGGGWPRLGRCLVAGLSGALIATVAYDLLGAVVFANDETGEPVPVSMLSRLLALLLVSLGTALGATTALRDATHNPSPSQPSPVPPTSP